MVKTEQLKLMNQNFLRAELGSDMFWKHPAESHAQPLILHRKYTLSKLTRPMDEGT